MLRRLWIAFQRDNLINVRNHLATVTVLVAVIYLVIVRWLLPEDVSLKHRTYLVDLTAGQRVAAAAAAADTGGQLRILESPEELRQRVQEDANSVGMLVEEADAAAGSGTSLPRVTLYVHGHHNPQVRNLLAVSTEEFLRETYAEPWPAAAPVVVEVLRAETTAAERTLGEELVPLLLFSDPAMIGLVFIAALIFLEKEEGTLKAFQVTPGRWTEYLLAKGLSLALLGVIFTLILAPPMLGGSPNYPLLLALMVLGSLFTALVGATAAVYFQNFSQFLLVAVTLIVLLSLPSASYFIPSFSPWWIRWLPTYPLMFGIREAALPTGNPAIVARALWTLVAYTVALVPISSILVGRQMARS